MYLLDTNVMLMLDLRRQAQARCLVDWIERNGASLLLSVPPPAREETRSSR